MYRFRLFQTATAVPKTLHIFEQATRLQTVLSYYPHWFFCNLSTVHPVYHPAILLQNIEVWHEYAAKMHGNILNVTVILLHLWSYFSVSLNLIQCFECLDCVHVALSCCLFRQPQSWKRLNFWHHEVCSSNNNNMLMQRLNIDTDKVASTLADTHRIKVQLRLKTGDEHRATVFSYISQPCVLVLIHSTLCLTAVPINLMNHSPSSKGLKRTSAISASITEHNKQSWWNSECMKRRDSCLLRAIEGLTDRWSHRGFHFR